MTFYNYLVKTTYFKLINILTNSDQPLSSKKIADMLLISSKSVLNFINDINTSEQIIYSSKDGYWINKQKASTYLSKNNDLPQNYDERCAYIIQRLLTNHSESINVYKLCDELFVSYSTIKNDILKMNQEFNNLEISFFLKNNCLNIKGSEKDKRKLMTKVLYDQHQNVLNVSILEKSFPDVEISVLMSIINETLKRNNYYLNDFSRINLVLHYAIIIDRMKNGHAILVDSNYDLTKLDPTEKKLIDDLCCELSSKFNLTLSQDDIYEFLIILKANAQKTDIEKSGLFREHIEEEIRSYTNGLVDRLKDIYYLDFRDDQFLIPFTLHLKNLLHRVKFSNSIVNPMADQIEESSPTIFEIALFIGKDFCEHFSIEDNLSLDEISFIAIHIGSQIYRNYDEKNKVKLVLVCPNYIHLSSQIRNKLLYNLGTKINIVDTISDFSLLENIKYDALISTVPLDSSIQKPYVLISPFLSNNDISKIFDLIARVNNKKSMLILKKDFAKFFSPKNFCVCDKQYTVNEAIHFMANSLLENGYVNENFESNVLKRENSSPTSFYNFAIPHSFEMDAKISGIYVLIAKKPIIWNSHPINIVLMISMNKDDNSHFYYLYEAIISILTDVSINNLLIDVNDFESFKNIILNY